MTAGRNIEINHDVDWIQDEDDNVIGYQRDPKTQVAIATWTDDTYSALRTPAGGSVGVGKTYLSGASKVFGAGSAGNTIGAGTTIVTQIPAEFDFVGVQLLYQNQSASAIVVSKAVVASTPTHQDTGATSTWQNVTFAGAVSGTVPALASGASADVVGGYLLSDFVPCTSVPRTDDATKRPLLQCRSYFAAAGNGAVVGGTDFAAFNAGAVSYGRQFASRTPAGDVTATFTATQQPLEGGSWVVPSTVIFHYPAATKTLLVCADSLSKGHLTTAGATAWPTLSAGMLRLAGKRFGVNNAAWTGQTQPASALMVKALVPITTPDYCAFFGWSPNDGSAQSAFDSGYARVIDLISFCRKNNVEPIICTSGPVNGLTAPQNAMRAANNLRLIALATGSGVRVFDFASVIEDPTNRSQILPAYSHGDGTHYNDAGHFAMANLATSVLSI